MNRPVPLSSALLTLVDPDRGAEVAFNRWYERDHFYGGVLLGPDVFAGARFLARAEEKRLRVIEDGTDPNRRTMLAAYWLTGSGSQYWPWLAEKVPALVEAGRMAPLGGVRDALWWPRLWAVERDPDRTPVELALDRRYPAAALTMVDTTVDADNESLEEDYRKRCVRPLVCGDGLAATVVGAESHPVALAGTRPRSGPARVTALWFLESAEPVALEAFVVAHAKAMVDFPTARTAWLSPFVAAVPGTDAHLDRLWL
jgi:hypothetical protein